MQTNHAYSHQLTMVVDSQGPQGLACCRYVKSSKMIQPPNLQQMLKLEGFNLYPMV